MKFRTEIAIAPAASKIDHSHHLLSVGSCFAESVSRGLVELGIPTLINPLGVMFNPLSIERCVERVVRGELVEPHELVRRGEEWCSLDAHGSFDGPRPQEVVRRINRSIEGARRHLKQTEWVIITLGTAWVYEREGRVVANCHKLPAREFVRRRLSVEEVVASLERTLELLGPERKVVLTVSPVRHLGDGLEGNAISKATLRLAVEEVVGRHPSVTYFPAYEILTDDLRDYRFYADDMVHPSGVAVEYVWSRFGDSFFIPATRAKGEEFVALAKGRQHRPLHPESADYLRFRQSMASRAARLVEEFPNNEVAQELAAFFGA